LLRKRRKTLGGTFLPHPVQSTSFWGPICPAQSTN